MGRRGCFVTETVRYEGRPTITAVPRPLQAYAINTLSSMLWVKLWRPTGHISISFPSKNFCLCFELYIGIWNCFKQRIIFCWRFKRYISVEFPWNKFDLRPTFDGMIYTWSWIMTLFGFKSVINIGLVDKSGMTFPIKRHSDFGVLFYDDWPSPPFHYQLLVRVSSYILLKEKNRLYIKLIYHWNNLVKK